MVTSKCRKCGATPHRGVCKICEMLAAAAPPDAPAKAGWPKESYALAVHPKQVGQANARNARHGIATRYRADGMAIVPTRADRKKLLKLEKMRDNSGGYGD